MEVSKSLATFLAVVAATLLFAPASAGWSKGSARFSGGSDASGTTCDACGYGNLQATGYGTRTASLSSALFNDGASCGQCYEVTCDCQSEARWCRQGVSVTVTAINLCSSNYTQSSSGGGGGSGGWCNPPRSHFDMAERAWLQIGLPLQAGVIPVLYQRVPCVKQGGVRFTITGKNYFEQVLITNVAGSGSVKAVWVRSESTGQVPMSRSWGANWLSLAGLAGQALTFGVTSTGGQTIVFRKVVPANWEFGQSFISNLQFTY